MDDAKKAAENVLYSPASEKVDTTLVSDILATWLNNKVASPVTLSGYKEAISLFLGWCDKQKPKIRHWNQLSLSVLDAYVKGLVTEGKAKDTIRLYTVPLRQASKKISKGSGGKLHHFADGFELPVGNQKFFLDQLNEGQHLPFEGAFNFVKFLLPHPHGWSILGGVLVQCFAGLRVMEAIRLIRDRIDLNVGLLSVEGQVKGKYAMRIIPIPRLVVNLLRHCPFRDGRLLAEFEGDHAYNSYNHTLKRLMREWDKDGKYAGLTARSLRRTLESEAAIRGWTGFAFNRYMGRAAQTIQEKHYVGKGVSQEQLAQMFRAQIVDRIDEVLDGIYHAKSAKKIATGKIVQFPLRLTS